MGEAGAGKDTIMQEILLLHPELHEIVSCTSRPKREKEEEGINYCFYSKEEFEQKIKNNEMFEYTEFNNWYYGTDKSSINNHKINIGVFNPQGIKFLINNPEVDVKVVWVRAADKTRLLRQLNRELWPDVDEIMRRYQTDKSDFSDINFEYMIINNDKYTIPLVSANKLYVSLGDWVKTVN